MLYKLHKSVVENVEVPAEYHRNTKLKKSDSIKVSMGEITPAQFRNNIRNGKYRQDAIGLPIFIGGKYLYKMISVFSVGDKLYAALV